MAILEITTSLGCKVACAYCPQDLYVKQYKTRSKVNLMSIDTLKDCVNKIPRDTLQSVVFSGYSEPFLNPGCASMVMYCVGLGLPVDIYTTLVGLTMEDLDQLSESSIKWLVHIPDNQRLTKIVVNQNYFSLLDKLIDKFGKVVFIFPHGGRLFEYVHPEVLDYLKRKKIPFKDHLEHSRAGQISGKGMATVNVPGKLRRCWRLDANVLLPNGDVTLCCQDFGQKHLLGNLLESDYQSLFTSDEFKKVEASLTDDSIDSLCRQCIFSYPENRAEYYFHLFFRLGPPHFRMRLLSVYNEMVRRLSR